MARHEDAAVRSGGRTECPVMPNGMPCASHLDVLEEAGLVTTRREGRYKFHCLDTSPLRVIVERWPFNHER